MSQIEETQPLQVMGPCGEAMGLDDLPPADTIRWVVRRKAEVVYAVTGGLLTVEEAMMRYSLTREEFNSWQRHVERSGLRGLRVRDLQEFRARQAEQQRPIALLTPAV
ncbi:DUF1153 domain-containing protein [Altererythrobacter xixiisoli]|uniref:DUF1153 domain-containing protein n=1 Tax=Croceibacterium xixiisoli TaxID=1476466 RepID=A0A6I4TTE9_9SPHN|nr:DUF1153 domain-containing protein [Croceibacterium xixiisoli]MXO98401.1 DUF1153 domain-containing protein [Croceibacterium xixiisoli]